MKMINGVLGCALVAGLMTFAAEKAQAGVLIGGSLYCPMKLKMIVQYESGGKIKKLTVTAKEALKELGYNSQVRLAEEYSFPWDIYVINKNSLVRNLTNPGGETPPILRVNYYDSITTDTKNGGYKEAGLVAVDFLSDRSPYDQFSLSGVYSYDKKEGKTDKKGFYKASERFKATALSGWANFPDLNVSDLPATGSTSYPGSGKLQAITL